MPVLANPYAPPVYNGVPDGSPTGYQDVSFDAVYNSPALTALQAIFDQVTLDTDADFLLRAVFVASATGVFSIRWADSQNYYLANARILSTNLPGDASSPYPWMPEQYYPAGGRIPIDLADVSNAGNTIQFIFRGVKRFRVAR
jgi:hypothetical protein